MMESNLERFWRIQDEQFFQKHPDRRAHIRTAHKDECKGEFWSLGDHEKSRRRIVLVREDFGGNLLPDGKVLKIPMIVYADETILDTDEVLLPMVQEVMTAEAVRQGLVR